VAEVSALDLADPAARDKLVEMADRLTAPSFSARDPDGAPPTALVVGDLTSEQRRALGRRLWAHGVRVEGVLEQPYRNNGREALDRVKRFAGDLLVIIQVGCRDIFAQVLTAAPGAARPILIAQTDDDLWRLELDEELDAAGIDDPGAEPTIELLPAVDGWAEAATRIRGLCGKDGTFVLTGRCSRRLERDRYPFPDRMAEQVESLQKLAARWSKSVSEGGLGADLVDIARLDYKLTIARSDEPMRRAGLHKFYHDGKEYDRQHHVKVDDNTTPDRVGRVYFALDDTHSPPRVIVDHVGLKLSPYVKR
jgi:hypothetical protein